MVKLNNMNFSRDKYFRLMAADRSNFKCQYCILMGFITVDVAVESPFDHSSVSVKYDDT